MSKNPKILLLNLPSASNQRLWRDTAGGFGTAIYCTPKYKRAGEASLHPFLAYASSVLLNAGYEFKVIDYQRSEAPQHNIYREVNKENPDIIVSIISLPSLGNDLRILREIRNSLQNVRIVGVGTTCRVIPNEILRNSPVDIAMRNSYPHVSFLVNLIQRLSKSEKFNSIGNISYKQDGKIFHTTDTSEPDIDELVSPSYDHLKLDGYQTMKDKTGERRLFVPIIESKGCPYSCSYCPYPLGFGNKIVFREPKIIADEMEHLYSAHNVKGFLLRGQTFAYYKKRAIEICEEIIKRKLDVMWFCECRVDEVSRELLNCMKKAGCALIQYGVETGNPETLKIAKPGVKLNVTKKAFDATRATGILAHAHIILGWPDDDQRKLENTRRFILKLDPDTINLNFLTPYPGTKMREIAERESLIITKDWSNYTSHTVVMRTTALNSTELYATKKRIIRDFSKQKLGRLFQSNSIDHKKAYSLINEAKNLLVQIISPQANS